MNRFHMALCLGVCALLAVPPQARGDVATGIGEKSKDKKSDKKKEFEFLPEARDVKASFVAGQAVEIELIASVGSLKQMEFTIRQGAKFGAVSPPRPHPRESNRAIVTYTHRGGGAELTDAFTYACRLTGGAWSAPGTVSLSGQRMEPKLDVLASPAFGRVFLGSEASARVAVRNSGTVDAVLNLDWREPWSGPPVLEVPKGGLTEFNVSFRPRRAGEFRHDVTLQPGVASSRIIFFGECVPAFSVSPGRLELGIESSTGQRSGTIIVANTRPEAVRAVFKFPPRLQGPTAVDIPANARVDVRMFLPAEDVDAFSGEAVVESGTDTQNVSLQAPAKPALMQVISPRDGELNFGKVPQNTRSFREISLSNAGGEPVTVEARARRPFNVGDVVTSVRIEPRGLAKIKVFVEPDRTGIVRGAVDLNSSTVHEVVNLVADVYESQAPPPAPQTGTGTMPAESAQAPSPPSPPAPPTPAPRPQTTAAESAAMAEDGELPTLNAAQAAVMTYIVARGLPTPAQFVNPYLEEVGPLQMLESKPGHVIIAWAKPDLPPSGWAVETSATVFSKELGLFTKIWNRHAKWQPVDVGPDKVGVRVAGLQPSSQYELRVMAVDREGKVSEPSPPLLVFTAEPWRIPSWVWRFFIAGALGLIGYILHRVRRGDFEEEED